MSGCSSFEEENCNSYGSQEDEIEERIRSARPYQETAFPRQVMEVKFDRFQISFSLLSSAW